MSRTSAAIAASAANRTRRKWERRADELRAAGYSVVEAGHVVVNAWDLAGGAGFGVRCLRCNTKIADWERNTPLPAVLHEVNSHVCEEKVNDHH